MIFRPTVKITFIESVGQGDLAAKVSVIAPYLAINFSKSEDVKILRDIEQYYSTQIDEMPMNGNLIVTQSPT